MKSLMKSNNGTMIPSIPSLLNDFLANDWLSSPFGNWRTSGTTLPSVNVRETNDAFHIEVAAPGMKRDDFKVELDNNFLTISAEVEQKNENTDERDGYTRREFSYQSFQRSFALPENKVEGEKIAAKYVDGILNITVPKKEEAKPKPAKQIKVA